MKKFLLVVAVALMTAVNVNAQKSSYYQTKHEIGISYGALSNSQWVDVFEDILEAPFKNAKYGNEKFFGPLAVEYFYHPGKLVGFGGILVYGQKTQDLTVDGANNGDVKNTYFTVMPAAKFDWLRKKNVGLYSKIAAGMTFRSEKDDNIDYSESAVHFNYQLSVLGVEVGSPTVRGFAELGFGEQGVFLGGVRFKF